MRQLLVTGAAGFIGQYTVAAARRRDWEVIAVDRRAPPSAPGVTSIQHEFSINSAALDLPQAPTAAILGAWPISVASYLSSPDNLHALHATIATAQGLLQGGCRQIIGVGTCAEYNTDAHDGTPLDESHPTQAASLYAACKISTHTILEQLCHARSVAFSWARIFNPYGVGEPNGRLIPSVVRQIKSGLPFAAGSGKQIRDYVAVEDIAEALVIMAEQKATGFFNVCTGMGISLAEVMHIAASAVGGNKQAITLGAKPDRAWDPPHLVGNASRLKDLGWNPRNPQDGLASYARLLGDMV